MDTDFCEDVCDVRQEDKDAANCARRFRGRLQIEPKQQELLEKAFQETTQIDRRRAEKLSSFVGLPYYKIKLWFFNRRVKERRSGEGSQNEGLTLQSVSGKRLRSENDQSVPLGLLQTASIAAPNLKNEQTSSQTLRPHNQTDNIALRGHQMNTLGFKYCNTFGFKDQTTIGFKEQTTLGLKQQTNLGVRQTTFNGQNSSHYNDHTISDYTGQKTLDYKGQTTLHFKGETSDQKRPTIGRFADQTTTHQVDVRPLCWPPVYHPNPSNPPSIPSMSRVLVDYLKENPHLLAPVHPAKRRRVEVDDIVPKCEETIYEKVKRWFTTMDNSDTTSDDHLDLTSQDQEGERSASRMSQPCSSISVTSTPRRSEADVSDNVTDVSDDKHIMDKYYTEYTENERTVPESPESGIFRISCSDSSPEMDRQQRRCNELSDSLFVCVEGSQNSSMRSLEDIKVQARDVANVTSNQRQ